MRLCDLNKALEELCKYCACGSYESCENRCVEFRNIGNIATIDAVPVVRCGKCVFRYCTGRCAKSGLYMDDDGFCSFGREDGDG